jgi:hypothetical protein
VLSGDGRDPVSLSQLKWRRLRLDAIGPQDLQLRSRKRGLACSPVYPWGEDGREDEGCSQ